MKHKILAMSLAGLTILSLCACENDDGHESNNGNLTRTSITRNYKVKSFNNISGDIDNSDLLIKKGSDFKVTYHGSKNMAPKVSVKNNQLNIKQTSSGGDSDDAITTVTVKQGNLNRIQTHVYDGDIELNNLILNDKLIASTSDGDIELRKLSLKNKGTITTSDGDIELINVSLNKGLSIKTSDGDITGHDVDASGYTAKALDGDISLFGKSRSTYGNINSNALKISTDSGDIRITR